MKAQTVDTQLGTQRIWAREHVERAIFFVAVFAVDRPMAPLQHGVGRTATTLLLSGGTLSSLETSGKRT
eukprot:6331122-Prymnesium_polylepis.1